VFKTNVEPDDAYGVTDVVDAIGVECETCAEGDRAKVVESKVVCERKDGVEVKASVARSGSRNVWNAPSPPIACAFGTENPSSVYVYSLSSGGGASNTAICVESPVVARSKLEHEQTAKQKKARRLAAIERYRQTPVVMDGYRREHIKPGTIVFSTRHTTSSSPHEFPPADFLNLVQPLDEAEQSPQCIFESPSLNCGPTLPRVDEPARATSIPNATTWKLAVEFEEEGESLDVPHLQHNERDGSAEFRLEGEEGVHRATKICNVTTAKHEPEVAVDVEMKEGKFSNAS